MARQRLVDVPCLDRDIDRSGWLRSDTACQQETYHAAGLVRELRVCRNVGSKYLLTNQFADLLVQIEILLAAVL